MRFCSSKSDETVLFNMKLFGIERLVKKSQLGALAPAAMAEGAAELASTSRREPRVFDLPCAICGGLATGYHYNVPSCNGCKTFFRRTVLSRKTYRCISGDGKCLSNRHPSPNSDLALRKKIRCRHCRYERCINQGMSPESVTTLSNLLEPETLELRRLLKLEQECVCYKPDSVSWKDLEKLRRLSGPMLETAGQGSRFRLPPDHEDAMSKDLLKANRFAADFEDFRGLSVDAQDEIIRNIVFPLTVAKEAVDLVDNEIEAQAHFGRHLAKLVSPFLRENVEHAEFVLLKTLFLINGICTAGCESAEETKSRHSKLVMRYLTERVGSQAPARLGTLMSVFQHFIASSGSTVSSPASSRSGSHSLQGALQDQLFS